jgi:predicted DNA-binding ribbon-helix-helix protein
VALEPEFWDALSALAAREGGSLAALVARIDAQRTQGAAPSRPLASALRVHALHAR